MFGAIFAGEDGGLAMAPPLAPPQQHRLCGRTQWNAMEFFLLGG